MVEHLLRRRSDPQLLFLELGELFLLVLHVHFLVFQLELLLVHLHLLRSEVLLSERGQVVGLWSSSRYWDLSLLGSIHQFLSIDKSRVLGQGGQLKIEVIAVEKSLDGVPPEKKSVLFELVVLLVLPFFIDVFLVEVVLLWWDEGAFDLSVCEVLPVVVLQPRVVFYFLGSV